MNKEVLIKVEGVSKKFCRSLKRSLLYGVQDISNELLGRSGHHTELRKNEFWAVNDISFELRRGECLGLIGPNGAGKSTLLKMLNGLIKPDTGRITMRGQVGALIELGAGFNPILTARENIYINGAVLGFSTREIERQFDAIIEFAEIPQFVDTPVQSFSSGMKVRLGFSIASQLQPDVLLIDEVLAVGDQSFRSKCMSRIYQQLNQCCVIFVSHSMAQINRICTKGLYLSAGAHAPASMEVGTAIEAYLADSKSPRTTVMGKEDVELGEVTLAGCLAPLINPSLDVKFGAGVDFSVVLDFRRRINRCGFLVAFFDQELRNVAECYSGQTGFEVRDVVGKHRLKFDLNSINLSPGRYAVQLSCVSLDESGRRDQVLLVLRDFFQLNVTDGDYSYASTQYKGTWDIAKA